MLFIHMTKKLILNHDTKFLENEAWNQESNNGQQEPMYMMLSLNTWRNNLLNY